MEFQESVTKQHHRSNFISHIYLEKPVNLPPFKTAVSFMCVCLFCFVLLVWYFFGLLLINELNKIVEMYRTIDLKMENKENWNLLVLSVKPEHVNCAILADRFDDGFRHSPTEYIFRSISEKVWIWFTRLHRAKLRRDSGCFLSR